MKPLIPFASVIFLAFVLSAADPATDWQGKKVPQLILASGKTYTEVTFTKIETDSVTISHAGGVLRIPMEDLKPEAQQALGYKPGKPESIPSPTIAEAEPTSSPLPKSSAPGGSPFTPVDLLALHPGKAFPLDSSTDEIEVKDQRIRRITLGADGKSLTILFDNQEAEAYRPSLTIWIVDKYGLPIRKCQEIWILDSVAPGKTESHDTTFHDSDTDDVLKFTSVKPPKDAGTPSYLVIDYN